jgi:hypothetical protein
MAKTLNMRFSLTNGKLTTLGLAQPKNGLSREQVEPVMQAIIDKEALLVKEATPAAIKSATIREVNELKLI